MRLLRLRSTSSNASVSVSATDNTFNVALASWTTAYVNSLPDSAFLYVAPGGTKDDEGKTTPRSLRYFPYRDSSGKVDLPHLRNALSRIPQADLSQTLKDQLTKKAQGILDNHNASAVQPTKLGASVNDVQKAFMEQVAQGDRYWWWIRAMFIDPNEIIADDGEENLFRLSYAVDGEEVSFGDPQKVQIHYVDVGDAAAAKATAVRAMASVREPEQVAASFNSREDSRSAEEGGNVDSIMDKIREKLGLAADTPDEEVLRLANEGLAEAEPPAEPPEPSPIVTPADETGPEAEEEEEESEEEPSASRRAARSREQGGVVQVDAATLAALQKQAQQGAAARERQIQDENESMVNAAIAAGKFPPARKKHWLQYMAADREGAIEAINGLVENMIPVAERGISPAEELANQPGYPDEWLPDVAIRKARLAAGHRPRVWTEVG